MLVAGVVDRTAAPTAELGVLLHELLWSDEALSQDDKMMYSYSFLHSNSF